MQKIEEIQMNKERILRLAEYIGKLPDHKFEMSHWLAVKDQNNLGWFVDEVPTPWSKEFTEYNPLDCGTVCCIAGWATAMENDFKPIAITMNGFSIKDRAQMWLDLTSLEAQNLFFFGVNTVWTKFYRQCSYDFDEYEDSFLEISNKDAEFVMKAIANGEINIDQELDYNECVEEMREYGFYEEEENDDY